MYTYIFTLTHIEIHRQHIYAYKLLVHNCILICIQTYMQHTCVNTYTHIYMH